jgi:hypothetical protein
VDAGVRAGEDGEPRGEEALVEVGGHGEPDLAVRVALQVGDAALAVGELVEGAADALVIRASGCGQLGASRGALEELRAQLGLQPRHGTAD